jgi:HlyD family secretion protein
MSGSTSRRQRLTALVEERPIEAIEQLDVMLRIVVFKSWLLLTVVGLTAAGFIAFACLYRVPLKVEGRGILLSRPGGENGERLVQVTAPASGRLARVTVAVGDVVRAGQVLAEIDRGEVKDQIRETGLALERLREEDDKLSRFDETEVTSLTEARAKVEHALQRSLELDQQRLGSFRQIATSDRMLKGQHFLSNREALRSQVEADGVESNIAATQARLQESSYTRIEDATRRRREKLKRSLSIHEAEVKLTLLHERHERESRLISPYAGRVVELMITPHVLVEKGTPAALLSPRDAGAGERERPPPLEALAFVPAGPGKKVRVDHAVEISPATVRRQEHGFIRGVVRSVSEIPATEAAMLAELKHKTLVAGFLNQSADGALLLVRIRLPEAPAVPGGEASSRANRLTWSSSSGAAQPVLSGTLCSASIVAERRMLIALVIPWAKHSVGLD